MAYPSYDQLRGSVFEPASGITVAIADHGGASTFNPFGREIAGVFRIRHLLSASNKNSLLSDYDSNRTSTFALTWDEDATSHTVFYGGRPQVKQVSGAKFECNVILFLVGTAGSIELESGDLLLLESGDQLLLENS